MRNKRVRNWTLIVFVIGIIAIAVSLMREGGEAPPPQAEAVQPLVEQRGEENQVEQKQVQAFEWAVQADDPPGGDLVLDGERISLSAQMVVVPVADAQQFQRALSEAGPGQVIELADGSYDISAAFELLGKTGTAERPIVIRAQNLGKAMISGQSWLRIADSSYIVVEGLRFEMDTSAGGPRRGLELLDSDRSRVTRNFFVLRQSPKFTDNSMVHWVFVKGEKANHNRIDRNLFDGKTQSGHFVAIEGNPATGSPGTGVVPQHTRVDRNHFRNVTRSGANGAETMRIGAGSQTVLTNAHAIVEYNLFERCSGEDEIISVKSSGNIIRYNTFLESEGAVVLRYGNGSEVYGNFFFGNGKDRTRGVRIHGTDHLVYNNYFERLASNVITIGWGIVEADPTVANVYWQVKRAVIAFNTMVDNSGPAVTAAYVQGRDYEPQEVQIANNIVRGARGKFVSEDPGGRPSGLSFAGNLMQPIGPASIGVDKQPHEIVQADLQFIHNGAFYQLSAGSPAIGAAAGDWPFVQEDGLGVRRKAKSDAGFAEYRDPSAGRGPLGPDQVGPLIDW